MKRRSVPLFIILGLIFSLFSPLYPAQAVNPYPATDLDGDGLSNTAETTGWYNLSGGPFITDPMKADSDQDGLTDSEEKLFNTNPLDYKSPGLSIKYENSFKTREYFSTSDPDYLHMLQGGNRYLLTEAAVLRRGTTFRFTGPAGASLTISGPGMTPATLTPVPDPAHGGWKVSLPSNGTTGVYTATVSSSGWSKNLPIYVIFELPATTSYMTDAKIKTFLYDDDPADKRDEVAVWFRAGDYSYYYYNNDLSQTPPDATQCAPDTPGVCSADKYHQNYGFAQAFWTEQFTKKVLVDFAIPAIIGKTTPYGASLAIATKADQSTRVNYGAQQNSFSSATHWDLDLTKGYHMTGGACETNAGVFTSILRSAGILSRPFNLDYNKTLGHKEEGNYNEYEYDHAVMLWVKDSGDSANRWYAERTSIRGDEGESEYQPQPIWQGGTTGMRPFDEVGVTDLNHLSVGFGKFRDAYADLVQSANEGWDWQNGSLGGGMVNTKWPIPDKEFNNPDNPADPFLNRDYRWDSLQPLQMMYQSPYIEFFNCQLWQGDGWAPGEWYDPADPLSGYYSNPLGRHTKDTYLLPFNVGNPGDIENWPYNPIPHECSPSSKGQPACTDAFKAGSMTCTLLPGQTVASAQAPVTQLPIQTPAVNTTLQLGNILSSTGNDRDGDGRFDKLVVTVELNSSVAGKYQLGGWLRVGGKKIRSEAGQLSLISGSQAVQVTFDGQEIGDTQMDGPYQVDALWAAPVDQPVDQIVLPEEMAAYQEYSYKTQAYPASAFLVNAASFGEDFSYTTSIKHNGSVDAITISTPLNIAISGTFTVEGDLYDGQGEFVGHAEWMGSEPFASLEYKIAKTQPPYSLEHLNLYDHKGKLLDARYAPVYKIENILSNANLENFSLEESIQSVNTIAITTTTPITNTFSFQLADSNVNNKYDQLIANVKVNVNQGGDYRIEGLLVDEQDKPAAWSTSGTQTLSVGQNRILKLVFDAGMLHFQLPLTGSKTFKITAVKIFTGDLSQASLVLEIPNMAQQYISTPAYNRISSNLEPSHPAIAVFQDDMENGETKWSKSGTFWSLGDNIGHIGDHAWMTSTSSPTSKTLTVATPANLTDYASPWLQFMHVDQFSANDSIKLEVSTNGTNWTVLKEFKASTAYWIPEFVDLSSYGKTANFQFRFNANNPTGSLWYLDDVYLYAGPAIKSAAFIASDPITALEDVTLAASYESIDKTLPVTYNWDFCGVARQSTNASITYKFPKEGDCIVTLTVNTPYDTAVTSQTLAITKPPVPPVYSVYIPVISKP
jgi:hypothetical protein